MNPDMNEERIGLAKIRVSDMLAIADVLEVQIEPEEIRKAALVPLPPAAERFVAWALNLAQQNLWAATLVLAGPAALGIDFTSLDVKSSPHRPRHPRRRPTAADRARRADEWLAGPARELGPEPEPSPDGGCP